MSCANRFMLIPKSRSVSLRISPGWTGGSLAVVLGDFDLLGMTFLLHKTDAVLIIDPDAALAFPISSQSFQAISRWNEQVVQFLGAIQGHQPPTRDFCNPL